MLNVKMTDDEYVDLVDELLLALTKETEQPLPKHLTIQQKRWLIDSLLEIRAIGDIDDTLLKMQDKLLSFELIKKGVKEVGSFKFKSNCADFNCGLEELKVDACVLFSSQLIEPIEQQSDIERKTLLCAGLQTKEEFAKYVQEYRNVLPHTKAYIIDAFNLPCKNIIKILVEAEAKNSSADYTNFLTAIKEVFLIAKQNQFKSLAIDLKTLSNIDPALTEIVKREIKNNKKIKILKNN